jgi:hypothetical protein
VPDDQNPYIAKCLEKSAVSGHRCSLAQLTICYVLITLASLFYSPKSIGFMELRQLLGNFTRRCKRTLWPSQTR